MTARYRDSRPYNASRERIFQACRDAMQPCGFSISTSDPSTFTIQAVAPYRETLGPNAGLMDEISQFAFERIFAKRFGESITVSVDEAGCVHALSVSRPSTTLFDQGKNRNNILSLWKKLDQYLLHPPERIVNSIHIDNNSGIVQNNSTGSAHQANAFAAQPSAPSPSGTAHSQGENGVRWDVGVITILSEEAQALLLALGLQSRRVGGLHFYEGETGSRESPMKVVATRALDQGQRSTMAAYENLRRHYDPRVFALVGIGGGIRADVAVGDVVVATRIVYYDLRKETPRGTQRRGEERAAPAEIGHAVNAFFTDHEPARFSVEDPAGAVHEMRMRTGLIGSGDAVIADHDADTLKFLAAFNDKVLAVDMEAGGLSAACHEQSAASGQLHGWVVIRGISDDAGPGKNDDHHRLASWHAAMALKKILPYLRQHTSHSPGQEEA
jgi:adenosylhomocysteine nucleosidase